MLEEPYLIYQESGNLLPEIQEAIAVTIAQNLERTAEVQAHHTDEALSVDHLVFVSHQDLKGLHSGGGDKFPDLLERMDHNLKLFHIRTSFGLYKNRKIVYNGKNCAFVSMDPIILCFSYNFN